MQDTKMGQLHLSGRSFSQTAGIVKNCEDDRGWKKRCSTTVGTSSTERSEIRSRCQNSGSGDGDGSGLSRWRRFLNRWQRRGQVLARRNVGDVGHAGDLAARGVVDADAIVVEQSADSAIEFDSRLFVGLH